MIHIVVFLLAITTIFEILPLITVPVTKYLSLSSFRNHYYGPVSYTHLDVYKRQRTRFTPVEHGLWDEFFRE